MRVPSDRLTVRVMPLRAGIAITAVNVAARARNVNSLLIYLLLKFQFLMKDAAGATNLHEYCAKVERLSQLHKH